MIGIIGSRSLVKTTSFQWMYIITSLSLYTVFHHRISDVVLVYYCLVALIHHRSWTQKDWSCADGLLEQEEWRAWRSGGISRSNRERKQYFMEDVSQKR